MRFFIIVELGVVLAARVAEPVKRNFLLRYGVAAGQFVKFFQSRTGEKSQIYHGTAGGAGNMTLLSIVSAVTHRSLIHT